MPSLLDLCDELLHEVFTYVLPSDLPTLSKTCRTFNTYIKDNKILWRDSYAVHLVHLCMKYCAKTPIDDEQDLPPPKLEIKDWEQELKDVIHTECLLRSENIEEKRRSIALVARTVAKLIERANKKRTESVNIGLVQRHFLKQENQGVFLFSSSLYGKSTSGEKRAGSTNHVAAEDQVERQLSAQLHTYFGTQAELYTTTRSGAAHPYARSKVYDLRNYNDRNYWGPYLDDRSLRPDWEKIEAIMIVLGFNMYRFVNDLDNSGNSDVNVYGMPFEGVTPGSYTPIEEYVCPGVAAMKASGAWQRKQEAKRARCLAHQPKIPLDSRDPYGVSGTWRRIVCFLDYNDLYAFNFIGQDPASGEFREPVTTQEAIRLITMKIKVTGIEDPGEEDGKDLPVVHFTGMSRSMHASWDPNANSKLTGSVRLTKHGDVRWTTLSIFHGEARWRSESIQLGGIRSARGVIGTWFDKDYDPNGPAGPTAFWKVCDPDQGHVWSDEVENDD